MTQKKADKRQIWRHAALRHREKRHELRHKYRQPADRKDDDNYDEHFDHFALRAVFSLLAQSASRCLVGPEEPADGGVEDRDHDQRQEVHGDEKDDGIDLLRRQVVEQRRPVFDAVRLAAGNVVKPHSLERGGLEDNGEEPDDSDHEIAASLVDVLLVRVENGGETVDGDARHREDRTRDGDALEEDEKLAQQRAEWPAGSFIDLEHRRGHSCGGDEEICDGHVDDLIVRYGPHFGLLVHKADDERVSSQGYENDERVEQGFHRLLTPSILPKRRARRGVVHF